MANVCIFAKTMLDMERIAAQRIMEVAEWLQAIPAPAGYKGIVLVSGCRDPERDLQIILDNVPEVDRAFIVMEEVPATLEEIAGAAARVARGKISPQECFAVRTVRRGKHPFTSIDVNVVTGDAVRRETGACVNLTAPDKIVLVEIIKDKAYIGVVPGSYEWRKLPPGKKPVHRILRKIRAAQMPYLGPREASYKMGVRVGREVQNFEIGELVIAPAGRIDAEPLYHFLRGLFEGIDSRYSIQVRSYTNRKPWKVPVYLQDIHQFVRQHRGEPIIVLEPEGKPVSKAKEEIIELFRRRGKVNILAGAREGIPLGIYRFADLVLDIAPGITLSTEYALSSAFIAIISVLYNYIDEVVGEEGS
ncbi:MAG: SPOUT family RNA methylase [Desulfurococcales archaeon]|nr:SPOUT family RNA methylase [Desulfurococcales archaeon]